MYTDPIDCHNILIVRVCLVYFRYYDTMCAWNYRIQSNCLYNILTFYTAGFFKPAVVANGSYQITAQFLRLWLRKCRFEMPIGLMYFYI